MKAAPSTSHADFLQPKAREKEGIGLDDATQEDAAKSGYAASELQALFPQPSSEEQIALQWAATNEGHIEVEGWLRKCRKWNAVAIHGSKQYKRKRLCKETDIQCTREVYKNHEAALTIVRSALLLQV